MQEEIENKTVTLVISGGKLTGRLLKAAVVKYLAHRKEKKHEKAQTKEAKAQAKAQKAAVIPRGKQSVKQLIGQNQGVSNIEINDKNIGDFQRVARKYGVDFAVKKDRTVSPPKYLVFFKARDADALTAAFTEYTAKTVKKANRPSVLAQLNKFKELLKNAVPNRTRHKEQER